MADDDSTTATTDEGATPPPAPQDTADTFKSEESKTRVLADLATERDKRQSLEARLKEFEDRDKTEAEKLAERSTTAETRATAAELTAMRLEVALDKGLTKTQAKRLVGNSLEELMADADDLLESFTQPKSPATSARPSERLRAGGDPTADPLPDPEKTADAIRRR